MHEKRKAILEYLRHYPHSYAPSVREIGSAVGLSSSSSVHAHLKKLEESGYIERQQKCPRCIKIL